MFYLCCSVYLCSLCFGSCYCRCYWSTFSSKHHEVVICRALRALPRGRATSLRRCCPLVPPRCRNLGGGGGEREGQREGEGERGSRRKREKDRKELFYRCCRRSLSSFSKLLFLVLLTPLLQGKRSHLCVCCVTLRSTSHCRCYYYCCCHCLRRCYWCRCCCDSYHSTESKTPRG